MCSALFALSVACGSGSSRHTAFVPAREHHVASSSCPLPTPAAWQHFLTATVEDERWVRTCSADGMCSKFFGAFAKHVEEDVLGVFGHCEEDVRDNPRIARCTAHLRRFAPAWLLQHSSDSYGFRASNREYLAAQVAPDKPSGMMDPPGEIVRALPDRARIEEAARENGWPFVTQESCFGGLRTFITIADRGGRYDQWFLVRYDDASAVTVPDNSVMSFIAVQKKDSSGRSLKRVRLHFRDYIVWKDRGSWQVALPTEHEGKCYACHGSGMRLLAPGHGRAVELNERLSSYGLPDWDGAVEPADHGPALGESLSCTACHDGVSRGVLTVSTDEGTLERKIVGELSMQSFAAGKDVPDAAAMALLDREHTTPLSESEASVLERARTSHAADYRTFMSERFPKWRAWALETPCE